jgi:apocytochrome f
MLERTVDVVKFIQQETRLFTSNVNGKIQEIKQTEKNSELTILTSSGESKVLTVPKELPLIVKVNDVIKQDQSLTLNPNVGGFGQAESEVVLQDPSRIYGYVAFCFSIIITQTMFVLKKKQFEKVQAAELDF